MKYTNITLAEMKAFLGPKFVELPVSASTKEYVFELPLRENPAIVIKVYSSIHRETGEARRCGGDAIRVCAVNIEKKIGWIKTTRVFRVEGWKKNLASAINSTIDQCIIRLNRTNTNRLPITIPRTPPSPIPATLRELNQKIKSITRSTDEQSLIDFIWGKEYGDQQFSAEASTLDANKQNRRRDLCPKCDGRYTTRDLVRKLENVTSQGTEHEERELAGWIFKCPHCNSTLTVFND